MISKETATRIALAYREIETAEKLIEQVAKAMDRFDETDIRDVFGRRVQGLQLGVPNGEMSTRCFELPYTVAKPVIEAHIAQQRAIIVALSEAAAGEIAAARAGAVA